MNRFERRVFYPFGAIVELIQIIINFLRGGRVL